jgi:uncharacterized DUF497 family protein
MDGDIAHLPRFVELKKRFKTMLMVDEAHSMGVLGKNGRGISEYFGVDPHDVDIWMGTLSKTFASCGGYITGSKELVRLLKYTAGGFVYSVGLTPANAGAALAVVRLLKTEINRVAQLHKNSRFFLELARQNGLDTGLSKDSSVVPVIIRDSIKSIRLANSLFEHGINVHPVLYPAVAHGEERLRKLGDKIDKLTFRAPWNEALHVVLKELYSEIEADVVVQMPYGLSNLDRIATITGYPKVRLSKILEDLSERGLVMDLFHDDEYHYFPSPLLEGFYEYTLMRTRGELNSKHWAELFHVYWTGSEDFYNGKETGRWVGAKNVLKEARESMERKYRLQAKGYNFNWLVQHVAQLMDVEPRDVVARGKFKQFEDAKEIFDGPMIVNIDDRHDYQETRLIGFGWIHHLVAVVVYIEITDDSIRILSARKANKYERKKFEKEIKNRLG